MSKLEELIAELCPDGVEYKTLDTVSTIERGVRVVKTQLSEDGVYPVFQNCLAPMGYYKDFNCEENMTYVISAGAAGEIGFSETKFWAADDCLIIKNSPGILNKYIYYYLLTKQHFIQSKVRRASIPRLSRNVIEKIKVPVPPLEIQYEIVRILDAFSELKAELNAVLKAELKTRKKQYEYYKEYVFNRYITEETQFLPLNELADVRDGTHDSPKSSSTGKYLITSKNIKNGTINFDRAYLISNEDFEKINQRSKVDKWDLLFTMIGTVGEIGLVSDEPDYAIKNVGLIKTGNEIFAKFLKYYLNTSISRDYVNENRSKGTQVFLALGKLKKNTDSYFNRGRTKTHCFHH